MDNFPYDDFDAEEAARILKDQVARSQGIEDVGFRFSEYWQELGYLSEGDYEGFVERSANLIMADMNSHIMGLDYFYVIDIWNNNLNRFLSYDEFEGLKQELSELNENAPKFYILSAVSRMPQEEVLSLLNKLGLSFDEEL